MHEIIEHLVTYALEDRSLIEGYHQKDRINCITGEISHLRINVLSLF